jgi:hypothetical protein
MCRAVARPPDFAARQGPVGQHVEKSTVAITVPGYDPQVGVGTGGSVGTFRVWIAASGVEITGDSDGLLDLARWCVALAAPGVPAGAHVHLDPGIEMLSVASAPDMIAIESPRANQLRAVEDPFGKT